MEGGFAFRILFWLLFKTMNNVTDYANDPIFQQVFDLVAHGVQNDLEVNTLADSISNVFPVDENGEFILTFAQCNALDNHFYDTGRTFFWREAYGNPLEDQVVTIYGEQFRAINVGVFTFNRVE